MPQTLVLKDGTHIPYIAFGSGTAVYGKDGYDQVLTALKAGAKHIDAAQMYRNEESVGKAIHDFLEAQTGPDGVKRDELFITTKLGMLEEGQTVLDALRTSLRKLRIDYCDLYLVHNPIQHKGRLAEVWKEMEEGKELGLARNIGVSNWRVKDFEAILPNAKIAPVINQIELHPLVFGKTRGLLDYMYKHDVAIAAYSGLAPITRIQDANLNRVLRSIVDRLESAWGGGPVTEGQVLLKWNTQQSAIVVTTTGRAERAKEYLAVVDLPLLLPEEISLIETSVGDRHERFFVANWVVYIDWLGNSVPFLWAKHMDD